MTYEFFKYVPRSYKANLRFRASVLEWSNAGGDRATAAQRRLWLYRACARDPLFFLSVFCWILEPRSGRKFAWVPYDFQIDSVKTLIESIEMAIEGKRADTVQAKSRDMGATWMCVFVVFWYAMFRNNFSALLVSRKAELVDSHEPDSLFYKLYFMLGKLPGWLRPNDFRINMLWKNRDRDSFIKGESTTSSAGVASRATVILLDEFSLMDDQAAIWSGSRDVSRCRIANFTLKPWAHTALALMKNPALRQIRLPWTMHPEKVKGLYQAATQSSAAKILDTTYKFPPNYRFKMIRSSGGGKVRSEWYDREEESCGSDWEMDTEVDMMELPGGQSFFNRSDIEDAIARNCRAPVWSGDILVHQEDVARSVFDPDSLDKPLLSWVAIAGSNPPVGRYVIGIDTSLGTGASNSCASIWNRKTGQKVAEYVSSTMSPDRFARAVAALGYRFRDEDGTPAMLKWETNGPGTSFGKEIIALNYPYYYFRKNEQSLSGKATDTPGWSPTDENKGLIFRAYAVSIKNKQSENPSLAAMEELYRFQVGEKGQPIHVNNIASIDPSGAKANHGDRGTADAIGWSEVILEEVTSVLASAKRKPASDDLGTIEGRNRFHRFSEATNSVAEDNSGYWKNGPYGKGCL